MGTISKPIKEIIRYSYKKFNLIFILCKPLNPNEIQLTEHLDYFWIGKTEFFKFQFLEGDISFIQNYLLNKTNPWVLEHGKKKIDSDIKTGKTTILEKSIFSVTRNLSFSIP